MQIIVNGEDKQIEPGLTAATLVEQMGLGGRRIAMEVNREILPRSRYAEHTFADGDRVEIVHAVGGG
ncbi:MAG: sulfur carrier protein ThiS [Thiohalophilus sp.]|uniref:sulfur carrier protein ThiS n=1 Tax=Thiohalophilus sp. TaxID=3028392 RepID=UPI00287092F5|nr:sulfur carrier protein ThiS [Thiohalophilus sp.]MDR9435575.1 sulfur carrier protein ThiS [Thiohalophilus sp.]